MELSMETSNAIYNHSDNRPENFDLEVFFKHYIKFVDAEFWRKDFQGYMGAMDQTARLLSGVNFAQNLLFICREDFSDMAFITGFMAFPEYKTVYKCNYLEVYDIFYTDRSSDIPEEGERIVSTEQSIREEIMCLFVGKDMGLFRTDEHIVSLISSRVHRSLERRQPLYNWVFFHGTRSDLENTKEFDKIIQFFSSNRGKGFEIVDLNSPSLSLPKTRWLGEKGSSDKKQIKTWTYSVKTPDSLDDIY